MLGRPREDIPKAMPKTKGERKALQKIHLDVDSNSKSIDCEGIDSNGIPIVVDRMWCDLDAPSFLLEVWQKKSRSMKKKEWFTRLTQVHVPVKKMDMEYVFKEDDFQWLRDLFAID